MLVTSGVASHADILLAHHAIRKDCVTNQKNVCVGGYFWGLKGYLSHLLTLMEHTAD